MATQTSEELAAQILDNFMQNGIGTYENSLIYFEKNDKLKTSLLAISLGAAIDEVSRLLEWQDFESLVAEILEKRDFDTTRGLILTNPRMQIDVVGIKSETALLIDCKHWQKMNQSSLQSAVKKQIERTRQFLSKEKVQAAIPAIVTLYEYNIKFINGVPIIPIYQLDAFCDEFYGNLDEFYSQNNV
ncbi:MAG: restriction endonuclease [Thaumarchaeota archaeon]|nr:MAG: restriction endonuclease [Nitrososphaerota archaeon]